MTHQDRHSSPALALAGTLLVAAVAGCESGGSQTTEVNTAPAAENATAAAPPLSLAESLEVAYLIGPTASRTLGYRIDWQTRTFPEDDSGIKMITVQEDSVFVLDGRNFLTRLSRADGTRVWRLPVAGAYDEVYGITYLPYLDRVFLTTGGDLLVLDADTGSLMDKQRLEQVAATGPVSVGRSFVYGARNGQLVWHSFDVGYPWRAYQVSPAMRLAPLLVGNLLIAVGSDGRIMALDAESGIGIWDKYLLDQVVAQPAAGGGLVYLAGLDQYLWALDIANGRRAWRHLTESPLVDSPVVIDDQLYQCIPDMGLSCFEAYPIDAPDGRLLWTAEGVKGNVIGRRGERVMVWDKVAHTLSLVEVRGGATITTLDFTGVDHLETSGSRSGNIVAAGHDGRIIRLVPRS
ncbi:MAG: outer membrane protein assembly factor BamB family protein [Planctomycetota bacterium]|jgi:outer membrane protein assembly factor BamB